MAVEITGILPNMIREELEGLYGATVLRDMKEIISLYEVYERGAAYTPEGSLDYVPADLRYKMTRSLVDKEVRFLFSKTPEFFVDTVSREAVTIYQRLINTVLRENGFANTLLKAAKDCMIGKLSLIHI